VSKLSVLLTFGPKVSDEDALRFATDRLRELGALESQQARFVCVEPWEGVTPRIDPAIAAGGELRRYEVEAIPMPAEVAA